MGAYADSVADFDVLGDFGADAGGFADDFVANADGCEEMIVSQNALRDVKVDFGGTHDMASDPIHSSMCGCHSHKSHNA